MNKEIEFEEILKGLPTTPLCEKGKELADFEGSWIRFVKTAVGEKKLKELEEAKYTVKDIRELGEAIKKQVTSFELNGELKEIDSHKNLENISFADAEEISEMLMDYQEEISKIDISTATEEQIENAGKMIKDIREKCLEIQNLNTENMEEWEKALLVEKVAGMAKGVYESPVGKN